MSFDTYTQAEIEVVQKFLTDMDAKANQIQESAHGNPADHQTARKMMEAASEAENFLTTYCQ